jgi:short-subunit dehydrogenase
MRERRFGRIINMNSVLGFMAVPFHSFYVAAKHALEGYTEALSLEVRPFGVSVVLIEPGYTRTRFFDHRQDAQGLLKDYATDRNRVLALMAERLREGSDPKAIARVVLSAVRAKQPAVRYTAGFGGGLLKVGRSLLPTSAFDYVVRKAFALE